MLTLLAVWKSIIHTYVFLVTHDLHGMKHFMQRLLMIRVLQRKRYFVALCPKDKSIARRQLIAF
jgi:hypothetical protein